MPGLASSLSEWAAPADDFWGSSTHIRPTPNHMYASLKISVWIFNTFHKRKNISISSIIYNVILMTMTFKWNHPTSQDMSLPYLKNLVVLWTNQIFKLGIYNIIDQSQSPSDSHTPFWISSDWSTFSHFPWSFHVLFCFTWFIRTKP